MTPVSSERLVELAGRVEALAQADNSLDVLCEVALFVPDGEYISCRANAAGTKVIYARSDGTECTHWAPDWTEDRATTAASLRALALRDHLLSTNDQGDK